MPPVHLAHRFVLSAHVERLLDDDVWASFEALHRQAPGGFAPIPLIRPPDRDFGEDERLWLERAGRLASRGPIGLHTHWTSPTHARPTGGVPAARVRREALWMREQGFEPVYFCGGGWYTDDAVRETVAELGLVDCTPRTGLPDAATLPTTHSLGRFARAALRPLPPYLHAYLHDYDLRQPRRRAALYASLRIVGARLAVSGRLLRTASAR